MILRRLPFLLVVLAALAGGANLIHNGRFESGLEGWRVTLDSAEGSWAVLTGPEFAPDIDNEVLVEKLLRYSASLSQSAAIGGLDTRFAFEARLQAQAAADTGGYNAHAAVTLEYQDSAGTALGRTMVLRRTAQSPLVNTPTRHLIVVPDDAWRSSEFVLRDELVNLPGVNPSRVARVAVRLEAYGNGTGG